MAGQCRGTKACLVLGQLFFLKRCIYFWQCWVFAAVRRLSIVVASGDDSLSWSKGFLLQWLLLLQSMGCRECGLSSWSEWAQLLCGMWDIPGPGVPCFASWIFFFFLVSSTSLLLPTHLPPPSCTQAQSCNPMYYSPTGSSVNGLFQEGILEWVTISFSRHFTYYE